MGVKIRGGLIESALTLCLRARLSTSFSGGFFSISSELFACEAVPPVPPEYAPEF